MTMTKDDIREIIKEETAELKGGLSEVEEETRRNSVLLEEQGSILQGIHEGVQALQGVPARLDRIGERLESLEGDMTIVKSVIKEHSHDIIELKPRQA